MRALRLVGERQIIVRERPDPTPAEGEVVIRLRAAGICGSDLHPYRHPPAAFLDEDVVPGHEPCGEIVALGPGVSGWSVGDRVVVYFRRTCGRCQYCRTGHRNVCVNRRSSYGHAPDAPGADAEYMAVEAASLMPLPDHLSFVDGAVLACQAGTAYWPLVRLGTSGRDLLVVSGLGPVGLLATQLATAMGARVVGIDPSAERRALAEARGAHQTLDPGAGPVADQLRARYADGADKLLETSGAAAAQAAIGELLRPHGQAAIVGLGSRDFAMPLMRLVHRELTVFGTSIYPDTLYPEICGFVRDHGIALHTVVSHTFSLEQGDEAFRVADSATAGKVMFRFD
ncbi:MAG TPA: alcohol dehydrogenase catalytic domain-containing protein [Chloroflexota bacterium]|nr:alcohol dehydrogenase catalytic domain-containing protein [Chloroflexota bacterium]